MSGFTFSMDAVQFVPGSDAHPIEALKRASPATMNQSADLGLHAPVHDESCRGALVKLTVVSMAGAPLLTMASAPNAELKTIKIAVQKRVPDSQVEKLVHEGHILDDMQTIEDAGIPAQATLQVVFGCVSAYFDYETPHSFERGSWSVSVEVAPGDLCSLEEKRKTKHSKLAEIDGEDILKIILDEEGGYYPKALGKNPEEAERLKSLLRGASSVMGFHYSNTRLLCFRPSGRGVRDHDWGLEALVSGHRVSLVERGRAIPDDHVQT